MRTLNASLSQTHHVILYNTSNSNSTVQFFEVGSNLSKGSIKTEDLCLIHSKLLDYGPPANEAIFKNMTGHMSMASAKLKNNGLLLEYACRIS